jgi:transcription initiation factor TFIIIB Brf1 subunit/transcription initiation factor TFIIB
LFLTEIYFMDKNYDKDYKEWLLIGRRWSYLKKYERDVLSLKYLNLEDEISRLAAALSIPQPCVERAAYLARQLIGNRYSPQALAAAALIIACRSLKMPRPISDFQQYVDNIEKLKKVLRDLSALMKTPLRLETYVAIIAARLNVPPAAVKSAIELLQRNRKALQGRNPWAAAAAALWLSGVDITLLRQFASTSAIRNIAKVFK